jgi:hypothetical protein
MSSFVIQTDRALPHASALHVSSVEGVALSNTPTESIGAIEEKMETEEGSTNLSVS